MGGSVATKKRPRVSAYLGAGIRQKVEQSKTEGRGWAQ